MGFNLSVQIEPVPHRDLLDRERDRCAEASRRGRADQKEEGVQEEAQTPKDDGPGRISDKK